MDHNYRQILIKEVKIGIENKIKIIILIMNKMEN